MPLLWTDDCAAVDWNALERLYRLAPLGDKNAGELKLVFTNSMFRCFLFDDGVLAGAGRVLADGRDCAYLCDIALHPDWQGRGLGGELISRLLALAHGHRKIILYAVPGKEPLYARYGFRRMTTAMAIFANPAAAEARGYLAKD